MITSINEVAANSTVTITVLRDKKEVNIDLNLKVDENGVYKTGLYVKDQINGIGTLTYIDPNTKIYGALGHEIVEKTTAEKFEIKDGKIFRADITSINKSRSGTAGEKNATYDKSEVYGTIKGNETSGIFGTYTDTLPDTGKLKVAEPSEIRTGNAVIRTVIDKDKVETFNINIIKLDDTGNTKNILFEITDERLLNETGGVVQGMSGSPIIQDDKIVGAVTHVIVNDSTKGYGIFITTMLKEGEK